MKKEGGNELFAQFIMRIYKEIPQSKIGEFFKVENSPISNFISEKAIERSSKNF